MLDSIESAPVYANDEKIFTHVYMCNIGVYMYICICHIAIHTLIMCIYACVYVNVYVGMCVYKKYTQYVRSLT